MPARLTVAATCHILETSGIGAGLPIVRSIHWPSCEPAIVKATSFMMRRSPDTLAIFVPLSDRRRSASFCGALQWHAGPPENAHGALAEIVCCASLGRRNPVVRLSTPSPLHSEPHCISDVLVGRPACQAAGASCARTRGKALAAARSLRGCVPDLTPRAWSRWLDPSGPGRIQGRRGQPRRNVIRNTIDGGVAKQIVHRYRKANFPFYPQLNLRHYQGMTSERKEVLIVGKFLEFEFVGPDLANGMLNHLVLR